MKMMIVSTTFGGYRPDERNPLHLLTLATCTLPTVRRSKAKRHERATLHQSSSPWQTHNNSLKRTKVILHLVPLRFPETFSIQTLSFLSFQTLAMPPIPSVHQSCWAKLKRLSQTCSRCCPLVLLLHGNCQALFSYSLCLSCYCIPRFLVPSTTLPHIFPPETQHALRSTCSARRFLAILSSPFCPIQLSTSILLLKLESHPFAFGFSCNFYVKKFVLFYEKNLFRGRPLSSRSTCFLFLSVLVPAFLRTPTFTRFFDISLRDISSSSSPLVQHPDHRLRLQTTSQVFHQIISKSRVHIQPFIQIVSINL